MQHGILHLKIAKLSQNAYKIKIKSFRKTGKRWPCSEIALGLALQIKWKIKAKGLRTNINNKIKLEHKKQDKRILEIVNVEIKKIEVDRKQFVLVKDKNDKIVRERQSKKQRNRRVENQVGPGKDWNYTLD